MVCLAIACASWQRITSVSREKIQMCIEANVVPLLVKKLATTDPSIVTSVLRIIRSIVTGSDIQTDTVINSGALNYLKKFLNRGRFVRDSISVISNMTGNQTKIQSIIDAGLISPLLAVMQRVRLVLTIV